MARAGAGMRAATTAQRVGTPPRTPARPVARSRATGEARPVLRSATSELRTCPLCGSRGVAEVRADDMPADDGEPAAVRCLVRCGGCETWRGVVLPERAGRKAHRRLRRRSRRAHRLLAHAVHRVDAALDDTLTDSARR
jgi:hypothetical protein